MATVFDVAAFILKDSGKMSAMKLQKLIYYSQAWFLAEKGQPLFKEQIHAWPYGPVCPDLYKLHRKRFFVETIAGKPDALSKDEQFHIARVLAKYGQLDGYKLSQLTHAEDPWKLSRQDQKQEIKPASMQQFYSKQKLL